MTHALSALALAIALCVAAPVEAQVRVAPRSVTATYFGASAYRAPARFEVTDRYAARRVAPTQTNRARPATSTAPAVAPSPGQMQFAVTENGRAARGTMEVRARGRVVASGDFTRPVTLPAGRYDVTFTLTTALDRPTQTVPVTVRSGGSVTARAQFQTAIVEVRFFDNNQPVYGRAVFSKNGQPVGSMGSRIVHTVSAGRYEVTAQYRAQTRSYTVDLTPGQRRAITARF